MSRMIPTKDFIILVAPEKKSRIMLPENRNQNLVDSTELIVKSIGAECKLVRPGDHIVADAQAIIMFMLEKERYFLTKEENVGCIIREEE